MPAEARQSELSRSEMERYSRQLVLPELGPEGQKRLKGSAALVIGAGGLGVPAAVYLAAAGVGRIGIVDGDNVEKSNLHRQTIYSESDVGRPKSEVAGERLRAVNPHVSVEVYQTRLDSSNAIDILRGYDIILDCTDNFPARYLINDACVILGKPDVYASVFRFDGQASVFDPARGPCYRCLFPQPPPPDSVQDCATAGVLGVLPGIMGGIQAVQAMSLLLSKGDPLIGRLLLFNAMDMTFEELHVRKDRACPVCGETPTIKKLIDYEEFCGLREHATRTAEIEPSELKRMLEAGQKVLILDVREPYEHEFAHIEGSKLIPLGELDERSQELKGEEPIVVYCHVGRRSARAVELLSSKGVKAINLKGGISAWSAEVDPKIPVY